MHRPPSSPILNTLTRLTLAATAITGTPQLACSPKAQVIQDEIGVAINAALDAEIAGYTEKANHAYRILAEYFAKNEEHAKAAEFYVEAHEEKMAKECYKTAAQKSEKLGAFYVAGSQYSKAGLAREAERLYRKGIENNEKEEDWFGAAIGYRNLKDLKKALECLQKDQAKNHGQNPYVRNILMMDILEKLEMKEEARQLYEKMAMSCESNIFMKPFAIHYYRMAGKPERAMEVLNECLGMMDSEGNVVAGEYDVRKRAINIATNINDTNLYRDYGPEEAAELEENGSYIAAAELFEKIGYWGAAKRCYTYHLNPPLEAFAPDRDFEDESQYGDPSIDLADEETTTTDVDTGPEISEDDAKAYAGLARVLKHLKRK